MTVASVLRAQADALEAQAAVLRATASELDAVEATADMSGLLTVSEVCERLRLHENTVLKMCTTGELRAWKVRGHWRIPASQVAAVLEAAS